MQNFRKLKVWEKGFQIAVDTYKYSAGLPKNEQFGLVSQMDRAAVSIPSNIAESSSRSSDRDKKRFIEIALGSSFELETQLSLSKAIYSEDDPNLSSLLLKLDEEQKRLNSYLQSLSR